MKTSTVTDKNLDMDTRTRTPQRTVVDTVTDNDMDIEMDTNSADQEMLTDNARDTNTDSATETDKTKI